MHIHSWSQMLYPYMIFFFWGNMSSKWGCKSIIIIIGCICMREFFLVVLYTNLVDHIQNFRNIILILWFDIFRRQMDVRGRLILWFCFSINLRSRKSVLQMKALRTIIEANQNRVVVNDVEICKCCPLFFYFFKA